MDQTVYLPYVSGLMIAYANQFAGIRDMVDFHIIFKRTKLEELYPIYKSPFIMAFSTYIWNEQMNLFVATHIKKKFPDSIVVFGGPQIPIHNAVNYLKMHPQIDILILKEGEQAFSNIIQSALSNSSLEGIPNITYRQNDRCFQNPLELIQDLLPIPSPYLTGIFDSIIQDTDFEYQAILETNRGCPYQCSFCNWGDGEKKLRLFPLNRVFQEIEWLGKNHISYVYGSDGNFGIHKRDIEIAKYLKKIKIQYAYPKTFRVCYAKNTQNRVFEIAKIFNSVGLAKSITLSLQSSDSKTLENIKRKNIVIKDYAYWVNKYKTESIPTYTEVLLGLPGETVTTFKQGIEMILNASMIDEIAIFILEALPNTDLTDPDYIDRFGLKFQKIKASEIHSQQLADGNILEYSNIIIGTHTMPTSEWVKCLNFSWYIQLFFGLKLLFFVLVFLNKELKIPMVEFIDFCLDPINLNPSECPFFYQEYTFVQSVIQEVLQGESYTVFDPSFGNTKWKMEELSFLRYNKKLDVFYSELDGILTRFLEIKSISISSSLWKDVMAFQRLIIKRIHPVNQTSWAFQTTIPAYFSRILKGEAPEPIQNIQNVIRFRKEDLVSWDPGEFARKVVWFGRKSQEFLYDFQIEKQN